MWIIVRVATSVRYGFVPEVHAGSIIEQVSLACNTVILLRHFVSLRTDVKRIQANNSSLNSHCFIKKNLYATRLHSMTQSCLFSKLCSTLYVKSHCVKLTMFSVLKHNWTDIGNVPTLPCPTKVCIIYTLFDDLMKCLHCADCLLSLTKTCRPKSCIVDSWRVKKVERLQVGIASCKLAKCKVEKLQV